MTGIYTMLPWPRSSPLPGAATNLTAADALYVALAEQLGASVLTDDQRLANSLALPPQLSILRLSVQG